MHPTLPSVLGSSAPTADWQTTSSDAGTSVVSAAVSTVLEAVSTAGAHSNSQVLRLAYQYHSVSTIVRLESSSRHIGPTLSSLTTVMEINSSAIITEDGAGAGAQYRVGFVGNGANGTFLDNFTAGGADGSMMGRRPINPNCLLFDFLIEAVFMGILCIFGFTGNTLSMICLWRDKSKTATPFLLVSLEVADTLFLVTVLLLRVMTSIHDYTKWLGPVMSLFPYIGSYVYPCALIAETGTIYLTVLVTVNRYISVCRPYEASNLCSVYHARRHVVLVTAFSVIFNLPRFFEYTVVYDTLPNSNITMLIPQMSRMGKNKIYQIVYGNALYCLVMFLVPLISLICLNYKLIKALRKTKKKRAQLISSNVDNHNRSEDDITLVLIVVVIVFVLSQTPALITQSLFSFLETEKRVCPNAFFYFERISDLMVVANSSMNFIIYCFCSTKFRQILINLCCKRKKHSPSQSMATRVTKVKHGGKDGRGTRDSMV